MAYKAVPITKFGGLNLSADAANVGLERAIVATNVELAADLSYVKTRGGMSPVAAGTLSGDGQAFGIMPRSVPFGSFDILALTANTAGTSVFLDSYVPGGSVTALGNWATTAADKRAEMVLHGTPLLTNAYIAVRGQLLRKLTEANVLSTVAGKPKFLGVTPVSNRLVQAYFTGATDAPSGANGSTSTVYFSDPGLPETWTTNNFVQLSPGDGETITAVVSWREQLFVFKQTKMFIFSGEGTDSTGQPVFDFRSVKLAGKIGVGSSNLSSSAAAGIDGVYYVSSEGVFRTTGGPPVMISSALTSEFESNAIAGIFAGIAVVGQRVYLLNYTSTYVFDERHGQWVLWTVSTTAPPAEIESAPTVPRQHYFVRTGTRDISRLVSTFTTDAGTAIASSYQSGLSDMGLAAPKVVRQAQLWGTGTVSYAMGVDYAAVDTASSLVLGTAPTADDQYDRIARRGTLFSYKVSATSGAWRLNGLSLQVGARWPVGAQP